MRLSSVIFFSKVEAVLVSCKKRFARFKFHHSNPISWHVNSHNASLMFSEWITHITYESSTAPKVDSANNIPWKMCLEKLDGPIQNCHLPFSPWLLTSIIISQNMFGKDGNYRNSKCEWLCRNYDPVSRRKHDGVFTCVVKGSKSWQWKQHAWRKAFWTSHWLGRKSRVWI